jgi:hypothetical protein
VLFFGGVSRRPTTAWYFLEINMTNATQINRNEFMYGFADMDAYIESVENSLTYTFTGGNMIVAGLMSDAQELIAGGSQDRARQTLNIAKFILFKIMDGELVGDRPPLK